MEICCCNIHKQQRSADMTDWPCKVRRDQLSWDRWPSKRIFRGSAISAVCLTSIKKIAIFPHLGGCCQIAKYTLFTWVSSVETTVINSVFSVDSTASASWYFQYYLPIRSHLAVIGKFSIPYLWKNNIKVLKYSCDTFVGFEVVY